MQLFLKSSLVPDHLFLLGNKYYYKLVQSRYQPNDQLNASNGGIIGQIILLLFIQLYFLQLQTMSGYQASLINQKFKTSIRRKQRQNIMKKGRQFYHEYQKKLQQSEMQIESKKNITIDYNQLNKNIKSINSSFSQQKLIEEVPNQEIKNILLFLISDQALQVVDSVNLLSKFIQFCGSKDPNYQTKVKIIKNVLEQSQFSQKILELIYKNIQSVEQVKLKLYLGCLKNMSLIEMKSILKQQLIEKYLHPIISNFISEPSVLIFLAYVSQFYPNTPEIVLRVCEQAHSKEKIVKVTVSTILTNYVSKEESSQNILIVFDRLMIILAYLYQNSRQFGQRLSKPLLQSINGIISKFPKHLPEQLLKKISISKIQDLMVVLLSVSNNDTKYVVFGIQETIVDKTIQGLKQKFFSSFSFQVIYQIAYGIQYTNDNIVEKCLKILIKIFYFAPHNIILKIESQTNISQCLENLVYHKNKNIASMAQILQKYLESQDQMNIEV